MTETKETTLIEEEIDFKWGTLTLMKNNDVFVELIVGDKVYVFHEEDVPVPAHIMERNVDSKFIRGPYPKYETLTEAYNIIKILFLNDVIYDVEVYIDDSEPFIYFFVGYNMFDYIEREYEEFMFDDYIETNLGKGMSKYFYADRDYNVNTLTDYGTYSILLRNRSSMVTVGDILDKSEKENLIEGELEANFSRSGNSIYELTVYSDLNGVEDKLESLLQDKFEELDVGITRCYNEYIKEGFIHAMKHYPVEFLSFLESRSTV